MLSILRTFFVVFYLVVLGMGILHYVFQSLALFTLGKRRQVKNSWLAWLPYGFDWVVGKIAEEYDGRNGIKRRWGAILLGLQIFITVLAIVMYVVVVSMAVNISSGIPTEGDFITLGLVAWLSIIIILLVAMVIEILGMICLYKIFESTVPEKAVMYMVISILVPLGLPICLMLCRNKGYDSNEEENSQNLYL